MLPEIAPDLVELTIADSNADPVGDGADTTGHDATPGSGSVAPEKR